MNEEPDINELMRQYREIGLQYGWPDSESKVDKEEVSAGE